MSRLPKETEATTDWLQTYLSRGPALASDIRASSPASWATTVRCKKALGISSKWSSAGWLWYDPEVQNAFPDAAQGVVAPFRSFQVAPPDLPETPPQGLTPEQLRAARERREQQKQREDDDWGRGPTQEQLVKDKAAAQIKIWLEPDPQAVLEALGYREIDMIKNTMRNAAKSELPEETLQKFLTLCRAVQKTKNT